MHFREYLELNARKDLLRFLAAGSVDDGKSTLIGRLLYDSKGIYEDQLSALERDSAKGSVGDERMLDLSLLTDGLSAEREQGITIDVAYRYFSTPKRKFIIADAPGHAQYTRNMATGASSCDLAVILIDASAGVLEQTRRHSFVVSLLGIRHVAVAINKMDTVNWDERVYDQIRHEFSDFAAKLEFTDVQFIPVSALQGDNVVSRSSRMPWYQGSPLLDYLERVHVASDRNLIDLRFPVQYVLRPNSSFRGFAGSLASGILRRGDDVMALPSRMRTRIASISTHEGDLQEAFPPMAVTVQLEDQIDLSRGDMIVHPGNVPKLSHDFDAMVVWMSSDSLDQERGYWIRLASEKVTGFVSSIRYRLDPNSLHRMQGSGIALNEIARVSITCTRAIAHDTYKKNRRTGSFVMIDRMTNATVACGMIVGTRATHDKDTYKQSKLTRSRVSTARREEVLNQRAVTVWITGLPRSGKASVAYALEERLVEAGKTCFVVNGPSLRETVNVDLGYSADDRTENLRRAAGIAKLLNDAGVIAIASFVSPFSDDRAYIRTVIGDTKFIEIYCSAPLEVCEQRDDEGLYERARSGEIENFTGVTAPYEPPTSPDVDIPIHEISVEDAAGMIFSTLKRRGFIR